VPHIKIGSVRPYCCFHGKKFKSVILYNFFQRFTYTFIQDNIKSAMLTNETLKTFVPTVKPQEAKTFYHDVLGLTLLNEDNYGIEFDSGGTLLRVITVRELTPHEFTILGWNVKKIEATINMLNEKGVSFEKYDFIPQDDLGIWTSPNNSKVAWFKDPDGNVLSVSQMP
jgi:predicted enzyme related to lactoylglutathione lyase